VGMGFGMTRLRGRLRRIPTGVALYTYGELPRKA
jgi:hypothetical protein